MESYPLDLILHHVPLLAVIGLSDSSVLASPSLAAPSSASVAPLPSALALPQPAASRGSGLSAASSIPSSPQLPSSSPLPSPPQNPAATYFSFLRPRLLTALNVKNIPSALSASAQGADHVTQPASGAGALFQVIALERHLPLPPRKLPLPLPPQPPFPTTPQAPPTPRSPLSPHHPASPLYPDGLISPLWLARHRHQVPAIVVGFYEIQEGPQGGEGRDRDGWLVVEINERKKQCQERNIVYAAVIMLRALNPTDPQFEERVSQIRRLTGLDSRTGLFVLPPVHGVPGGAAERSGGIELVEWVGGLLKSLHEPSTAYYAHHNKRLKRARLRIRAPPPGGVPDQSLVLTAGLLDAGGVRPLGPLGWIARYEFKMAVFREFGGDLEGGVRHYLLAHAAILEFLGNGAHPSSGSLATMAGNGVQPWSTRWGEARVVLDCINLKIMKLLLYMDLPQSALAQLYRHLHACSKFPEHALHPTPPPPPTSITPRYPTVPTPPGESGGPEWWAWAGKQYRIFGELVELATSRLGLKVPVPQPGSAVTFTAGAALSLAAAGGPAGVSAPALCIGAVGSGTFARDGGDGVGVTGRTSLVGFVQHAGYYYLIAARCAEERRRRVLLGRDAGIRAEGPPPHPANHLAAAQAAYLSKLMALERSVDHTAAVIELLTKAYEQYKKLRSGRTTLWLAGEIARTYAEGGKWEMALRFFDRISKTYRKEKWNTILKSILAWSLRCAREVGDTDKVISLVVELMSSDLTSDPVERSKYQEELMLALGPPESPDMVPADGAERRTMSIDMDQVHSFSACSPFSDPSCNVEATDVLGMHPMELPASALGPAGDIWILKERPTSTSEEPDKFGLSITPGHPLIIQGSLRLNKVQTVRAVMIALTIERPSLDLVLEFPLVDASGDREGPRRRWIALPEGTNPYVELLDGYGEVSQLKVIRQPPRVSMKIRHSAPAYLEELYPIDVEISNEDTSVSCDPSTTIQERVEQAHGTFDSDSQSKFSRIEVGTVGHQSSLSTRIYIQPMNTFADRIVHVTLVYRMASDAESAPLPGSPSSSSSDLASEGFFTAVDTLRIPIVRPFDIAVDMQPRMDTPPFKDEELGIGALGWDSRTLINGMGVMVIGIKCVGPWDVEVDDVTLVEAEPDRERFSKVLHSDLATNARKRQVWKHGHTANFTFLVSTTESIDLVPDSIPVGVLLVKWRRRTSSDVPFTTVKMDVPHIRSNTDPVRVTTSIPQTVTLGHAFTVTYLVTNVSAAMHNLVASVDVSEGLVFSGPKVQFMRLLPLAQQEIRYNCVPTTDGKVRLPRLKLVSKGYGDAEGQETAVKWNVGAGAGAGQGSGAGEGASEDKDIYVYVRPHIATGFELGLAM
ncbi:hypothetical protein HDU93_001616 [Gonapodya sp. JEL0774]|nr:hypothetical protein HDU93_001616 [Gonapodya sp. JEL0774]